MADDTVVITLMCERAADVNNLLDSDDQVKDVPGVKVVKFPCSGMIQPLMIEAAVKAGASGVIVCGCQIGDCYYREGNKMIRDRLLGARQPGLKKTVDRKRVLALWLSRLQASKFASEAKEFVSYVAKLDSKGGKAEEKAKPAAKAAEKAKPAAKAKEEGAKPAAKAEEKAKPAAKAEEKAKPAAKAKEEGDKAAGAKDKADKSSSKDADAGKAPDKGKSDEKKAEESAKKDGDES